MKNLKRTRVNKKRVVEGGFSIDTEYYYSDRLIMHALRMHALRMHAFGIGISNPRSSTCSVAKIRYCILCNN